MYTPHAMAASPDAGATLLDSGTVAPAFEGPHDEVIRPTGLGRGVWEGPHWLFIVVPIIVCLLGLGFLVQRIGPSRIRGWFRRK